MVDFHRMLRRLRIWKEIKAEMKCDCRSELPVSCYGLGHDNPSTNYLDVICNCPCHAMADSKSHVHGGKVKP